MVVADYHLNDRYLRQEGRIHLTGVQALARIPIEQLRIDQQRGLNTAALVSGYPGSPLAGLDAEMTRAVAIAGDNRLVHQPAVNEELAATAVMGSQLAASRPDCRYDGVIGMWYGKAPGLDRATDALRHGVFCGTSRHGGALAVVGDDPESKSSTMPSSSDAALVDLHMPILYPATIGECLELGLHGVAMSRATGLWSSLKIVTPIADGSGSVTLPDGRHVPELPVHEVDGTTWQPQPSAQFLGKRMVAVEQEFHEVRLELARQYGVLNSLNQLTTDPSDAWIGIVATGYTYSQVLESLRRLGLPTHEAVAAAGIRLLQLRLPVPFDHQIVDRFARGLQEILVVEEKNPTLERLIRDSLYTSSNQPAVNGKRDDDGRPLLPSHGLLDADTITPALRSRLEQRLSDRLAPPPPPPRPRIPVNTTRTPFFCSGCPHNWGTKVPDSSLVGMGTGCHGMTLLMDESRVGESAGITAMGNEGAQWIGMAPFVATNHMTQNLGDGTYFHSAQLAVQAAVGAGTNVTFKLLYNDTVAMTGGQQASFQVTVPRLAEILLLQGVAEVAVTTDEPDRYAAGALPADVTVHKRDHIVAVQERLAQVSGVTVLIHDQACAAETRRARRRGTVAKPRTRVVINHRICEGCGNCGDVSNCLSVQPLDTPLGRKTTIDQASCNIDLSCLGGDCPAFMTLEVDDGSDNSDGYGSPPVDIPTPSVADPGGANGHGANGDEAIAIRLAGIGGTGVVTIAQILSVAGLLAGLDVDGVDQTGLSQKAGPVVSDVTMARSGHRRTNLIGVGQADVLLAFDLLVAVSGDSGASLRQGAAVVASTSSTPTGRQITAPGLKAEPPQALLATLTSQIERDAVAAFDAQVAAAALTGVPETANMLLLGSALQAGLLPVPLEAIEEAVKLNGVAVEANLSALTWGRLAVHNRKAFADEVRWRHASTSTVAVPDLPGRLKDLITACFDELDLALIELLTADLVAYQNEAYARHFVESLSPVAELPQAAGLVEAAARGLHHLMAYKDEYEVARLMLSPDGLAEARRVAGGKSDHEAKLAWHLHPPMLRALGMTGKIRVPAQSTPAIRALAAGRRLRGRAIDPFGRAHVRRLERALADEHPALIATVASAVDAGAITADQGRDTLNLCLDIRGYEDIKVDAVRRYRAELASRLIALDLPDPNGVA